ncbi:hypothetical protein PENCOP_c011G01293 [Penicillium coprophilum]|uniref:Uncharacterized protein n=1 Tax=Penicillium coprophilum TaxID=36646 RepID=A0A1V6UEX2_9EURO|nr:hypothetical protein PENCOP_c011G01293 [Penicillium coprophilum]
MGVYDPERHALESVLIVMASSHMGMRIPIYICAILPFALSLERIAMLPRETPFTNCTFARILNRNQTTSNLSLLHRLRDLNLMTYQSDCW